MSDNKTKYITAKQLAEELLKNPNDIVAVTTDNFEQGQNTVPKKYLSLSRFKGKIVSETFRDAFDGGSYNSDVVRYDDKGDTDFVKL